MANYSVWACLAMFFVTFNLCHSFNYQYNYQNNYQYGSNWLTTNSTWYGDPYGAGSTGGSCGYQSAVLTAPFSSMITAVAPSLYHNGNGCGDCFQVKCTWSEHCSGSPVTVVVTDSCPGCEGSYNHKFDLSGTSFGAMAIRGHDALLRNIGSMEIQYQSVDCNFVGVDLAFRTDSGSNPYYFAMAVEYENGDELSEVAIKQANGPDMWKPMQRSWGAVFLANFGMMYKAPYSIKLTDHSNKVVIAENVIPADYTPGQTYRSFVNFPV